jgi:hypothetical protein
MNTKEIKEFRKEWSSPKRFEEYKELKEIKNKMNEIKEQIQQDLMAYLDGIDEAVGNKEQEIITNVCKIVVNNFNGVENGKEININK